MLVQVDYKAREAVNTPYTVRLNREHGAATPAGRALIHFANLEEAHRAVRTLHNSKYKDGHVALKLLSRN